MIFEVAKENTAKSRKESSVFNRKLHKEAGGMITTPNTTKELINKYADIAYPSCSASRDHIIKSTSIVVETSAGFLIRFEKPTIQTSFCFGTEMYSNTTKEEMDITYNLKEYIHAIQNYFIQENMRSIEEELNNLKKATKVYFYTLYDEYTPLATYLTVTDDGIFYRCRDEYLNAICAKEAIKEDIELLIKTLEEEKQKFTKRLNTYLKRYGLFKLDT